MSPNGRIEFVDLEATYNDIRDDVDAAIARVCESAAFVGGGEVAAFEAEWAAFVGAPHAVGVANGTDAIQLALMAAELPPGTEVLVPANTFIATAEAVVAAGHTVRFVDVDPRSGLIAVDAVQEVLSERVGAIIVVHLYGRVADVDAIMRLATPASILVIEDAAQAHDGWLNGRHAGTIGDAGTFSFYPGKNLGAFGDAGAVVTTRDDIADRVRLLRDHGRRGRDNHVVVGVNSRLDALQAAVLRAKLPHLTRWTAARRSIADLYRSLLPQELLDWMGQPDPQSESHHLFPVVTERRDELASRLSDWGISTGVHYRVPCPLTPAFQGQDGHFPVAKSRAERQLSLPIHPYLSADDVSRVIDAVAGFWQERHGLSARLDVPLNR